MKKNNKSFTPALLIGFSVLYGVILIVNAVQAILGRADLARHRYPIFAATVAFTAANLPDEQRARIRAFSALLRRACSAVIRRTARCIKCSFRSLCRMPGAFVTTYKHFMAEEAC